MKGTQVQFSVAQGLKGPEAADIRPMAAPPVVGGAVAGYGGGAIVGGAVVGGVPVARTGAVSAAAAATYYGVIKAFHEDKGWGHISCPQTHAMVGKDIFLLKSQLQGAHVAAGDNVSFSLGMGLKGPEAMNVKVLGSSLEQQVFYGTVKQWNEGKNFGFLQSDDSRALYAKDIFVHRNHLGGRVPVEGEPVQFSVVISDKGRPEASGVAFASDENGGYGGGIAPMDAGQGYGAWKGGGLVPARPGPWGRG
eukprot:SRR837773.17592.p3 GENE.SRR837773.17592~~SRR837773.17592.p3  ORF type:complete len:276 (+),score=113.57 SRR837773.17592:79-828(+)